MRNAPVMAAVVLIAALACHDTTGSSTGGLSLSAGVGQTSGAPLDAGRVLVRGPTNRSVDVQPGSTVTIDNLAPGTYTVALEGLVAGEVDRFGSLSGVEVEAGRNTAVTVTMPSFVPTLTSLPASSPSRSFTVTYGSVAGAASYRVEVATDLAFAANRIEQDAAAPQTSASVAVPADGTYHVRVRALDPYQGQGRPSAARTLVVQTAVAPAAPSGLTATAVSASEIDLAWTDNSADEDGFRVERCAGAGCTDFTELVTLGTNVRAHQNTALAAGTSYSYRVRAYNAIGASAYSNVATAAALTLPDLIVESLTHAPANPTTASSITFTAVVRNVGGSPAAASTLELRIGGETPGASQTKLAIPALAAGATASVSRQSTMGAGSYRNTATADIANAVAESNETNNVRTDDYTVATAQQADLVISAPATLTVTPSTVGAGQPVTLSGWTVRNQGTAASNGFRNGFYLSTDAAITSSDIRLDENFNSSMAPGAAFAWGGPTLTIPASTPPGSYFIGILVDDQNGTAESNETNNSKSVALTVAVAPLLRYAFEGSVDNSGTLSGYNGSATSVTYPAGRFGKAIKFSGTATTAAVLTGTKSVFQSGPRWTISLWYREDGLQTNAFLWMFRSGGGWETYHGVSSDLVTTCSDGGCTSFPSPAAAAWHSLVYRYNGVSATQGAPVEIYVDGALRGTIANPGSLPLVGAGVTDMRLGNHFNGNFPSLFYVDELRVYNDVFTPAQQCTLIIGGAWTGTACAMP